jgi:hypothetical protein
MLELWKRATLATIFQIYPDIAVPEFNEEEFDNSIQYGADYLFGRYMKIEYETKKIFGRKVSYIDVSEYDAYNGDNVAEDVVNSLSIA